MNTSETAELTIKPGQPIRVVCPDCAVVHVVELANADPVNGTAQLHFRQEEASDIPSDMPTYIIDIPHTCSPHRRFVKLSCDDVDEICELYSSGEWTMASLAIKYNVSRRTIGRALGPNYGDLPGFRTTVPQIAYRSRRFTNAEVRYIRSRYEPRVITFQMLADDYNCSPATIRDIVNRRTYKDVP